MNDKLGPLTQERLDELFNSCFVRECIEKMKSRVDKQLMKKELARLYMQLQRNIEDK